jgi:hypothetical protein
MSSKCSSKPRRRKSAIDRPSKPYPDFPLSAANCGQWQKKRRLTERFTTLGNGGR